jgi:hypothetical protein
MGVHADGALDRDHGLLASWARACRDQVAGQEDLWDWWFAP